MSFARCPALPHASTIRQHWYPSIPYDQSTFYGKQSLKHVTWHLRSRSLIFALQGRRSRNLSVSLLHSPKTPPSLPPPPSPLPCKCFSLTADLPHRIRFASDSPLHYLVCHDFKPQDRYDFKPQDRSPFGFYLSNQSLLNELLKSCSC